MFKTEFGGIKSWGMVCFTTFVGAFALSLLSTAQKMYIGAPLVLNGYLAPFLFGGISGATFGILNIKLYESNIALQQANDRLELKIRERTQDLEKTVAELQNALSEVKSLSGLLPICSHCKKIRNDEGYWQEVESYIHAHSEARFSHSICRDCAKKYYPDYDIYADDHEKS